ncbi:MAG: sigma 54-interacting transcriptional regulator [Holophaga sp.]|nr:sigma 54-interacting transcriptional regulator [Holophaga sp.]
MDGILICNSTGHVEYYTNFRPDINSLTEEEVLGKHILEVYPHLDPNESCILKVLKSGEPIYNELQNVINLHEENIRVVNTTLPIRADDSSIIGAVDVSRFLDHEYIRKDVTLTLKKMDHSRSNYDLYTLDDIYSESTFFSKIKEKIKKIANTYSNVMIFGETGTGKEMFAQAIHSQGLRRKGPFISQNCAAIPFPLLEGLLFGTEKGSFTGAVNRPGLFELASGGTLFLDEINSMDMAMQPKILKAIEEKRIRRIGSNRTINLDLRIISALNEDPNQAVERGRLREDIFFRLSTILIQIPPLRDRREDIRYLTNSFIRDFNASMNMNVTGVTDEVEQIFNQYQWPGNIRELKNIIEGIFNFITGDIIKSSDLPEYVLSSTHLSGYTRSNKYELELPLPEYIWNLEKKILVDTLEASKNLTDMANRLKISKQALNYKLQKFSIPYTKRADRPS